MKNLVYARFEEMTVNEVSELMRIASGKMAIKVASVAPTLFRVSAYGIFDGDVLARLQKNNPTQKFEIA